MHILDNECSEDMKTTFRENDVIFQLVPPYVHRRNAAERAIQTWKDHFMAGLAACDPNFPIREWDRLLPQADISLNLMRQSRRFPNLSAYASIWGNFDYNATPMAPPGTKVLVHETPAQRKTFGAHGVEGWYIGPALNHYRCFQCYIPSTASIRHALTVEWFPHKVPFPKTTTEEYLRQIASDLISILKTKNVKTFPNLEYGNKVLNAFQQIATILQRATTPIQQTTDTAIDPNPITAIKNQHQPHINTPPPSTIPKSPRVQETHTETRVSNDKKQTTQTKTSPTTDRLPSEQPNPREKGLHPMSLEPRAVSSRDNRNRKGQRLGGYSLLHQLQSKSHRPLLDPRTPRTQRHRYITRYGRAVKHLAQCTYIRPEVAYHIYNATTGKKESIEALRRGADGEVWETSLANEWGRLAQGVGNKNGQQRIKGTNTIFFISKNKIPQGRKVTYPNFICDLRPQKTEKHRVRLTAGGDRLDYPGDPSSPTVSLLDVKLHLNSVISSANKGARYFTVDIKDFYLGTPMSYYQYMKVHKRHIPAEIFKEYNIELDHLGYAYVEIQRGIYGLKEAGTLAHQQLVDHLATFGYKPVMSTPGLWKHETRPTTFTLCVDDFGIKYYDRKDALHLIDALNTKYKTTVDWEGSKYCGMELQWDYNKGHVDISMPNYIRDALTRFGHTPPRTLQHSPHAWKSPAYGQRIQQATIKSSSPTLNEKQTKVIQAIVGTLLYYARGVDPTMLPALNEISTEQAAPTLDTERKVKLLMDYAYTHPNATIRYRASDMVLQVSSDAAYLVLPGAKSRAGGHFFLSDGVVEENPIEIATNGPVHTLCKTIKNIMSSAAEAELGALYMNAREAVPIRQSLTELGHPQPATPLETDNSTAHGILTSTIRQKLSKAFDMRWYWLRDRVRQRQFRVFWRRGKLNLADYFTKHHPPWYHKKMRNKFLIRTHFDEESPHMYWKRMYENKMTHKKPFLHSGMKNAQPTPTKKLSILKPKNKDTVGTKNSFNIK